MERIMAGEIHHDIPAAALAVGDWVEFWEDGCRIGKVIDVHNGRKHKYILLQRPLDQRTKLRMGDSAIKRVWRKGYEGVPGSAPPECFLKCQPNDECFDSSGKPCLWFDRCRKGVINE